uniref:Uncharacterized protein n=1 Tax=Cannabis sativa TaxID=3483 RepID=A0A803P5T0_CANSA
MLDVCRLGRRSELGVGPHEETRGREKFSPPISSSFLMACERNGVRTFGETTAVRVSSVARIMWPIWTTVVRREARQNHHAREIGKIDERDIGSLGFVGLRKPWPPEKEGTNRGHSRPHATKGERYVRGK